VRKRLQVSPARRTVAAVLTPIHLLTNDRHRILNNRLLLNLNPGIPLTTHNRVRCQINPMARTHRHRRMAHLKCNLRNTDHHILNRLTLNNLNNPNMAVINNLNNLHTLLRHINRRIQLLLKPHKPVVPLPAELPKALLKVLPSRQSKSLICCAKSLSDAPGFASADMASLLPVLPPAPILRAVLRAGNLLLLRVLLLDTLVVLLSNNTASLLSSSSMANLPSSNNSTVSLPSNSNTANRLNSSSMANLLSSNNSMVSLLSSNSSRLPPVALVRLATPVS